MINVSAKFKYLFFLIDGNFTATGYTTGSHTTGYNRCMACHTASYSKDTLCRMHTFNIFR